MRGFLLPYNSFVLIVTLFISLISLLSLPGRVLAISDPLSVPNNKVGIHLLFPSEIQKAADLVNHQGSGSWGYVVIPIQANDRDRVKWQKFFDQCLENKAIPIIRVATVGEGAHWAIPNDYDLVDFANFLADLRWPVQNRYLIFFNEVNRADEYGGVISPENYADILSNAVNIFKSKSADFFILPAGLDNAATDRRTSIYWKDYLWRMFRRQPDIFDRLDGWTSHAYPNPDFSGRPNLSGSNKIDSFKYDLAVVKNFTQKKLPIFITEVGWSNKNLSDHQISLYYQYAFDRVWSDPNIVTVTPFVLDAQDGPFKQFSFIDTENRFKEFAMTVSSYSSVGNPQSPVENEIPLVLATNQTTEPAKVLGTEIDSKTLLQRLYNSFKTLIAIFR